MRVRAKEETREDPARRKKGNVFLACAPNSRSSQLQRRLRRLRDPEGWYNPFIHTIPPSWPRFSIGKRAKGGEYRTCKQAAASPFFLWGVIDEFYPFYVSTVLPFIFPSMRALSAVSSSVNPNLWRLISGNKQCFRYTFVVERPINLRFFHDVY